MENNLEQNKIVFRSTRDKIELEVRLDNENVWLTQDQMAFLFNRERSVVTKHINNIFKEEELDLKSNVQILHISGSDKPIKFYNLDVIISVGYRVKSKQGTQFRIWANKILKEYLVKGYAVNQSHLLKEVERYHELQTQLKTLRKVNDNEEFSLDESKQLIKIITDYANGLNILDKFDHNQLKVPSKFDKVIKLEYKDVIVDISKLRLEINAGELFGNEKDEGLKSALEAIYQTYDGKDLYPSIEEKAANLLYLIIKNHPFTDGNKRIGSFLFVRFLDLNKILYKGDGTKSIEENTLVAIALLMAQSDRKDKDEMVKLVVNLIGL